MNVIRKRVLFTGHVQGVGFRYTAHNIATKYDVRGFVRNLPDGKVEMIVEGPVDQVRSVIADLSDRMEQFIQRVDAHDAPVSVGEFHEFSIRHG